MTLTELSIKRPSLIIVIFLALGTLGIYGYFQLRYELLPKINVPVVTVVTVYPGASPAEVENSVTRPIEDAVSGVDKIASVRSTSYEGQSVVVVEFEPSADINLAMQDAQRKVNSVILELPQDARTPVLQKVSLDETPVISAGVTSRMPPREFYQFLEEQIKPAFSALNGVGQVNLIGGIQREIRINLDAEKINAYGLSIAQVAQRVNASNLDFPTGTIQSKTTESVVRIAGRFESLADLRNLIVSRSQSGSEIRLKDIAEVEDGQAEVTSISRINGKPSVGINILKQSDANTVSVSELIKAEIQKLEQQYAYIDLKFEISQDQSIYTLEAADAVKFDLMLAILLVAAVMFLFLHSLRNSLIVLVAIPSSLVASLLVMWMFDFSLNLLTLLALSLVIGILVDDSIVVLENIYHHLEKGEPSALAALRGRNEIGFAALSITMVDVVVFVPLALITGLIGDLMREFSIVIVCSTLMSLFVSFTITPMLASRFSKLETVNEKSLMGRFAKWFESQFNRLTARYLTILDYSLNNPIKILFATALIFFGSLALPALGLIGSEFIAQSDEGEFVVQLELAPRSSIDHTNRVARQAEQMIAKIPEVERIFTKVGTGAQGTSAKNQAEITVSLVPREKRQLATAEVSMQVKKALSRIPGVRVITSSGGASAAPIQIMVSGSNPDSINVTARNVADALKKTPGVTDVKFSAEQGKPEIRIEIERQKMAAFGWSVADVGTALQVALTGNDDSKFREGGNDYTIRIILDRFDRTNAEDIAKLTFINPAGQKIQLQQFANIYQSTGPTKLERTNRNPSLTVSAFTDGRPSGSIVSNFQKLFNNRIAGGTTVSFEGDQKNMEESFQSLLVALAAGILFVYFIMVALYNSFISPFIVLFSIPVAITGALAALALTGESLSIFSMLGMVMLVGLVAKNAILLVDRANDNKSARFLPSREAIMEAGKSRIRPIFMTTLSMVFGMLPIALAKGAGSEWKNGLAWALIGGLTSSMFLTLVVVPIVYMYMDKIGDRARAFFQRYGLSSTTLKMDIETDKI